VKDMPNLEGFSGKELFKMILLGVDIKKNPGKYSKAMKNKTMVMWFEKASLRTRVSFETAMTQMGGHAIYLDVSTTHSKKAKLEDEVKCLSRYADIIIARVFDHETIAKMQEASSVPVINALCNKFHPCQAMADMMTLHEVLGSFGDSTMAYVGDGNNVCNSLITASKKLGVKINVATPELFKPMNVPDLWTANPKEAVKNADAVYTDTWVSMGEENNKQGKLNGLSKYQVTQELIGNRYFMHCLPAIRGQEVTDEVLDSSKSLVFEQAENRLHIQKAIILELLDLQ